MTRRVESLFLNVFIINIDIIWVTEVTVTQQNMRSIHTGRYKFVKKYCGNKRVH